MEECCIHGLHYCWCYWCGFLCVFSSPTMGWATWGISHEPRAGFMNGPNVCVHACVLIHDCGCETGPRRRPAACSTHCPAGAMVDIGGVSLTQETQRELQTCPVNADGGKLQPLTRSDDAERVPRRCVRKPGLIQL